MSVLRLLPTRGDSAAANMAADLLLLKRYPDSRDARLRLYSWHRPAVSFGYSQRLAWVRERLPAGAADAVGLELVRRPSGGGVVDHRDDWTYALVVPRGHELEAARALESYRAVHAALARALAACGQDAVLKARCEDPAEGAACAARGPGVCFEKPELFDVVRADTGAKIAGAAQKRTREGLLLQGSVARAAATGVGDWDRLGAAFAEALAETLGWSAEESPWPEYPEGEAEALTEQFASVEWLELR